MLKVNDIVDAEIKAIFVFGIYCDYEGVDILIRIPELSWIASFGSCDQYAGNDERLKIKILAIHDGDKGEKQFSGSIKHMYPNPWELDIFELGKYFKAKVQNYVETSDRYDNHPAYLMEIIPGSCTMLKADGLNLRKGQTCEVVITEVDKKRHSVKIQLLNN